MPAVLCGVFSTIGMQKIRAADDRFQSIDLENKTDLTLKSLSGCVVDFIRCHWNDSSVESRQTCETHSPNQRSSLLSALRCSFRFSPCNTTPTDWLKRLPSNPEISFIRITYFMGSSVTSSTAVCR